MKKKMKTAFAVVHGTLRGYVNHRCALHAAGLT